MALMNGQAGDDPINNPNHNPSVGKSEGLWYNFQEGDLGLDQGYYITVFGSQYIDTSKIHRYW